jgi:hypothetical protein
MANVATIEPGDSVYCEEGGSLVGAVREVHGDAIVVWVENAGEFWVGDGGLRATHDGKVILDYDRLEPRLRQALAHARDAEVPGL